MPPVSSPNPDNDPQARVASNTEGVPTKGPFTVKTLPLPHGTLSLGWYEQSGEKLLERLSASITYADSDSGSSCDIVCNLAPFVTAIRRLEPKNGLLRQAVERCCDQILDESTPPRGLMWALAELEMLGGNETNKEFAPEFNWLAPNYGDVVMTRDGLTIAGKVLVYPPSLAAAIEGYVRREYFFPDNLHLQDLRLEQTNRREDEWRFEARSDTGRKSYGIGSLTRYEAEDILGEVLYRAAAGGALTAERYLVNMALGSQSLGGSGPLICLSRVGHVDTHAGSRHLLRLSRRMPDGLSSGARHEATLSVLTKGRRDDRRLLKVVQGCRRHLESIDWNEPTKVYSRAHTVITQLLQLNAYIENLELDQKALPASIAACLSQISGAPSSTVVRDPYEFRTIAAQSGFSAETLLALGMVYGCSALMVVGKDRSPHHPNLLIGQVGPDVIVCTLHDSIGRSYRFDLSSSEVEQSAREQILACLIRGFSQGTKNFWEEVKRHYLIWELDERVGLSHNHDTAIMRGLAGLVYRFRRGAAEFSESPLLNLPPGSISSTSNGDLYVSVPHAEHSLHAAICIEFREVLLVFTNGVRDLFGRLHGWKINLGSLAAAEQRIEELGQLFGQMEPGIPLVQLGWELESFGDPQIVNYRRFDPQLTLGRRMAYWLPTFP